MAKGKFLAAAMLVSALAAAPGCIVYDIRDQMVATNNQLTEIKFELARTNEHLSEVKANLATTNQTLAGVEKRLDVLDPINKSLASLDESLKTVKSLIEKIPFVGPAKEAEKKAAEGSAGAPTSAAPPK